MRLGWGSRQFLALVLLAVVLAFTSGLFEVRNVTRLSARSAVTEAEMYVHSILSLIIAEHEAKPDAPLEEIVENKQIRGLMESAMAMTSSLTGLAVIDQFGTAVAHAIPEKAGQASPPLPDMPLPEGFGEAIDLLNDIRADRTFGHTKSLMQGDVPFASIQAEISGGLIWEEARTVLVRGLITGMVVIAVALILGMLLGRAAQGRIRILEAGVAAIREGRSEPIPETGADMFGHLARELNILRDRVQMEPRVLANMEQVAAGMAHEVQQPIQALQFSLDAFRDPQSMPPEELNSLIDSAKTAVERMKRSVEGYLTVVRIKPMHVESLSVNPIIEDVQQSLITRANLAGLEIDLELQEGLPETYADGQVLLQAMENLVKNAIDALPSREGRVVIRSRREDDYIFLSVEDTGPGVPAEIRDKIFKLYFTTKGTGTGVGLALIRQAAEIHGGEILMDTETGRGTTFTLKLPLRPSSSRPAKKSSAKAADPGATEATLADLTEDPVLPEPVPATVTRSTEGSARRMAEGGGAS